MKRRIFTAGALFSFSLCVGLGVLSLAANDTVWDVPGLVNVHIKAAGKEIGLDINPPDFTHSDYLEFAPINSDAMERFFIGYYHVQGYTQPAGGIPPGSYVERALYFKDWFVMVALAILPAAWVVRRHIDRRRIGEGCCRKCGYDLRASTGACPECGTGIR